MFGIASTTALAAQKDTNARRRIAWEYPTGTAPLMALLSMIDNEEETTQSQFTHHEERFKSAYTTTAMANAAGPFMNTDGSDVAGTTSMTIARGTIFKIKVVDASDFRWRDVVWLRALTLGSGGGTKDRKAIVTEVDATNNVLTVRALETWTGVSNAVTVNTGIYVTSIGTAAAEGDRSGTGGMKFPVQMYNQTQIFRTDIGPWTRNALKLPTLWDETGAYKKNCRDAQVRHMIQMELAFLFSDYGVDMVTTKDGYLMPENKMGGLLWSMKQWEKGNVTNGGLFEYRPGGADVTSSDWRTEDLKRIVNLEGGNITLNEWESLMVRAFISNSNVGYEKLGLCDRSFLHKFNKVAKNCSLITRTQNSKEETYGFKLTSYETESGIIHFATSPLFNDNPAFSDSCMIVDVGRLTYQKFQDTDTTLLKDRGPKDADYRKDEWMTECGLKTEFPESHLFIEGLGNIIA